MSRIVMMGRWVGAAACAVAAAAWTGPAAAQTAVLYGLIDAAGSHSRDVGGQGQWRLDNGDLQRSFLGIRGSEDLGGGLRAVFRLESYLRVDTGSAGRFNGDPMWARESSVGLSGAFGTTVLGRTATPLYLTTINFNPFGESPAFSPSARQYYGPRGVLVSDSRWSNSLSYSNNATDAPLRVNLAANLAEEPSGAQSRGRNFGASVAYITGPFALAVAAERVKNSEFALPSGFDRQTTWQANATYDFTVVRVYGQVGRAKTEADLDQQSILYQLGVAVPVGTSLVLASYGHAHQKSTLRAVTDRTTSIGYDYFLSKNTDVYVAAMLERLSFVSSGNALAGGLRLRF